MPIKDMMSVSNNTWLHVDRCLQLFSANATVDHLQAHADWQRTSNHNDLIGLLCQIQNSMYSGAMTKYPQHVVVDVMTKFYVFHQSSWSFSRVLLILLIFQVDNQRIIQYMQSRTISTGGVHIIQKHYVTTAFIVTSDPKGLGL
jgi:hypothetical protein